MASIASPYANYVWQRTTDMPYYYLCTVTMPSKVPSDARIDKVYTNYKNGAWSGSIFGAELHYTSYASGHGVGANAYIGRSSDGTTWKFDQWGNNWQKFKTVTTFVMAANSGTPSNTQWRVVVEYTANTTSWTSTSTLSLSRSGTSVTATKGGAATNSLGSSVTYYLYEGSTNKGTFSGNTLTLNNVSAGTHTYKVVASAGGKTADGKSASITVPAAAITWSDATLTLAQNITEVTATMGGTATHNYGTAVTYYLYEDSTQIGTFSNNTLTFTPSVGAHTYKTVASGGGISADGASASITVVPPYKTLKIYNGSEWIECIVYRYDGNSFIEVEPYYYDGTNWSECSHT